MGYLEKVLITKYEAKQRKKKIWKNMVSILFCKHLFIRYAKIMIRVIEMA